MKLLTLNVHSWLEIHQYEKIRQLAEFVVAHDVDVIALQEVNQHQKTPVAEQTPGYRAVSQRPLKSDNFALILMDFLRQAHWEGSYSWVDSHEGWGVYDEGISLISRYPVHEFRAINMSPKYPYTDVRRRCALAASLNVQGKKVVVASTHMSWWELEGQPLFAAEFAELESQLKELGQGCPIFVAGDFNNDADTQGEGYSLMIAKGWKDTYDLCPAPVGSTTVHKSISGWDQVVKAMRIDYVFVSPSCTVTAHSVEFADDSAKAISDHSAVFIEIDNSSL